MECVIFDMDGVIIDSEPIHMQCEREILNSFNISISLEEHNTYVGTSDKAMWQKIKSQYGLAITVDELIELKKNYYLDYLRRYDKFIKPIPYIRRLIHELFKNNFKLAVASSSPHVQIDFILKLFNLSPYFHIVVSGEDVDYPKPDPGIFLKVSDIAAINPDNCIVIEDSYNGLLAAINAKMKCIGFRNPNSGNQDLGMADLIINSYNEVNAEKIKMLLKCN